MAMYVVCTAELVGFNWRRDFFFTEIMKLCCFPGEERSECQDEFFFFFL